MGFALGQRQTGCAHTVQECHDLFCKFRIRTRRYKEFSRIVRLFQHCHQQMGTAYISVPKLPCDFRCAQQNPLCIPTVPHVYHLPSGILPEAREKYTALLKKTIAFYKIHAKINIHSTRNGYHILNWRENHGLQDH